MPSGRPIRSSKTRRMQGGVVHPELEALLVLQEKDRAVADADAALAGLEPEVRVLDEALAAAERAVAAARRVGARGEGSVHADGRAGPRALRAREGGSGIHALG